MPDLTSGTLLLTYTQAARELGVSLSTVQRLVGRGVLSTVDLDTGQGRGASKRIRRADLARYVHELAVTP